MLEGISKRRMDMERSLSVIIDKKFINNLPEDLREKFLDHYYLVYINISKSKKKILRSDFLENIYKINMYYVYTYCPYCKKSSLKLKIPFLSSKERYHYGIHCGFCGEVNFFEKGYSALDKAHSLLKLKNLSENMNNIHRVLLEQCVVILASSLEVFLKDAYSVGMNLFMVKPTINKIEDFRKSTQNDFINIGKIIENFKQLNINIKELIDEESRKNVNIMFKKRHVIVHNNSIADTSYISQTNDPVEIGKALSISDEEVERYFNYVEQFFDIIGNKVMEVYVEEMKTEFIRVIWNIAPFTMIERVIQYRPTSSLLHSPNFITYPDITKVFPRPIAPSKKDLDEYRRNKREIQPQRTDQK
ncbi:MAG: hypothetical protein LBT06_17515 [Hungatella sp.]|jgi:hypothetical protein|nr:hypothetical protein [Hungatella sp.]